MEIEDQVFFHLSYGVYLVSTKTTQMNGCIINTVMQLSDDIKRIAICINNHSLTNEMIKESKKCSISILPNDIPYETIMEYGYKSGKNVKKFQENDHELDSMGLPYLKKAIGYISGDVESMIEFQSHTLFIIDVKEAHALGSGIPLTYDYYQKYLKPQNKESGYQCSVCGFVLHDEVIEDDFICPICKHGKEVFVELKNE